MKEIVVNTTKRLGPMKPMHAVNNGPVYKFAPDQRITNLEAYKAAGIPYARTHDAAFYATYGGEHTVDIGAIFPNFDADPEDPASYDFPMTDEYMKVIELAGTKTFYRLGSKIEHGVKKYGTLPPKDFKKWAVICEHIIRHYTEGWANGFHMDMPYWEIWNEPDLDPDDSPNKRCWGGTKLQFFELYDVAARHLKQCFPHLQIGGPALAHRMDWAEEFLAQLKAPLDFFSWHIYSADPNQIAEKMRAVREMLDAHGFAHTESILNEWNYVKGWTGEEWLRSLRAEKSLKGAAFIAATMCLGQAEPLDMLMYYDARPCAMNGMFCTDYVCDLLKGYYPFLAFNALYQLGWQAETVAAPGYYAVAAENAEEAAAMIVRFSDDPAPEEAVKFTFETATPMIASFYLLDETRNLDLIREETFASAHFSTILTLPENCVCLVKLRKA